MSRSSLSVVKPGDKPEKQKRVTILEAAEAGDRLAELVAMRRRLAKALDDPNCPPRDMAALSRRQLEIGREIDAVEVAAKKEADDNRHATEAEAWDESAI